MDTMKKEPFDFTVSPADPCMLFKENNLGIWIIIMYVDDMLIIGKKEQIQEFAAKNTEGSLSLNPTQPGGLFGLLIPHEQRKDKRMLGTTIYNQKSRAEIR